MPDEQPGQPPPGNAVDQSPAQAAAIAAIEQRVMALEAERSTRQKVEPPKDLVSAVKVGEICLIVINTLLLIATIVIAVIYTRQLREMRKATHLTGDAVQVARDTLTETQNSNARQAVLSEQTRKDASAAAKSSSDESAASLQATIQNFHADQRAWIGASPSTFDLSDGKPLAVIVSLTDTGKTPGLNLSSQVHWIDLPEDREFTLADVNYQKIEPILSGTIFPNQIVPVKAATFVSVGSFDDFRNGIMILYVYGRTEYQDIYGANHWTEFCYVVSPDLKTGTLCKIYNATDNQRK
jgi:Sec-independent protein translocase protein TatA